MRDLAPPALPTPRPEQRGPGHAPVQHHPPDRGTVDLRRLLFWTAYDGLSRRVQSMEEGVAPELVRFFHADKNPDLRAVGFHAKRGWDRQDLIHLAEAQQLPSGGPRLGGLFRADNDASTTMREKRAMAGVRKRRGATDGAFLGVEAADNALQGALAQLRGAIDQVAATREDLGAVDAAIAAAKAHERAEDARAEIERIKDQMDVVQSFVGGFIGVLKIGLGGDDRAWMAEGYGMIAANVLDVVTVARTSDAKQQLAAAEGDEKSAAARGLRHQLEGAKARMRVAVEGIVAARFTVLTQLTLRRQAYDQAGAAAGQAARTDRGTQAKIAALVSAIPIVEVVIAGLERIVTSARGGIPPHEEQAAVGYGIAHFHGLAHANQLTDAMGVLAYSHQWFGETAMDWRERLDNLRLVKDQLAGARPDALSPDDAAAEP